VLLVLVFVLITAFLRDFRAEGAGFEQEGALLLLYHLSRLGLAVFITTFCFVAGYRALELIRVNPQELFGGARKTFILCFFFGATLYGIVFTVLGLAGLISLEIGLAFTIPVLLFCYRPLKALIDEFLKADARQLLCDTQASEFSVWFVILMAVGTALIFFLTRTVFIAVFDPNIWEHYLHYYRAVLASGSTQPNEVWHHFYATKGAGLIFLANVLSDIFGAQIVSACFVIVAAVIILDLLLEYSRSTIWAFFGVMLFFTFMYGQMPDGATFKHHGVILGYMSFTLWGSVWIQQATARQFRPLMIVLVLSLAYFSFYQPAAIVLLLPAFLLLVLMNVALQSYTHLRSFLFLACGVFAGSALVFGTNWVLTGLPEVTPMRWTWAIADRAKVAEVFGTGGIEFFIAMNNDLATAYDWSFKRTWKVLRYPLPTAVVYLSLLGILIVLIRNHTRDTVPKEGKFLVLLAAFILPLSAFAQAVQSVSVDRVALYSIVFTTLASVVALKLLIDVCVGIKVWHAPSMLKRLADINIGDNACHVASMVVIVFGIGLAMVHGWKSIGKQQRAVIYKYVSGAISLKESMRAVESFRVPLGRRPQGTSIDAMSAFRKTIRRDGRILGLTYDVGFSYALPSGGIVSEPTYSLIRNPERILAEKPDWVAEYLRERDIRYLTLNLQRKLFSTIAFTSLFDSSEITRFFSVAYEEGDFFVLTWRENDQEKQFSPYLLTLIDLKRSGVLNYPFSQRFANLVISHDQAVSSLVDYEITRDAFLKDVEKAFIIEVLPQLSLEASRTLLRHVLEAGKDAVESAEPGSVLFMEPAKSRLRQSLNARGDTTVPMEIHERISKKELKERFLVLFRDTIYKEYISELGSELASLSRRCDERFPFATKYPTDATCN
jgi:hypothetical protein